MNASKKWGREARLSGHTFWVRMSDEEALLIRGALSVCLRDDVDPDITLEEKFAAVEMIQRINDVVVEGKRMSANRR